MNADQQQAKRERGIAVLFVALFLLVSLWFVSMAIDVGKVMAARTELQAAADAAALAGASAIDPVTGVIDQPLAKVRAAAAAASNKAYQSVETAVVIDPEVDVEFPLPYRVKVTVKRTEDTGNPVVLHFAQTFGMPTIGVQADATAEAQELNSICEGLAPFAPTNPPGNLGFFTDCDSSYTLKVGAGNSSQGNFQLLDYPPCNEDNLADNPNGGDAVRYYTKYGYQCCISLGSEFILTEPGNKVGPLSQGLEYRWDQDTDQTSHCYGDYEGNGKRIFITPIIETFDVNGKKIVRIVNFAAFFMTYRPQGSMAQQGVQGQFIQYVAPGEASGPPVDTGIYGLHLVE
ncbi:MAG TPA: pilus assembly protein TadG-related protein [Candidatus Eisenbacteria bacterium]|nr:pilus assembly protein TadG-related protein [Candidatus Eisenbacteria bacterium]